MPLDIATLGVVVDPSAAIRGSNLTNKAIDSIGNHADAMAKKANLAMDSMAETFFKFNQVVDAARNAFDLYERTLGRIINIGVKFNATLEGTQYSIAGILQTFDRSGQIDTFEKAMTAARSATSQMQKEALKSLSTFEGLAEAYNMISPSALQAGMSTERLITLIRQLGSIFRAGGMEDFRIPAEIRQTIMGSFTSKDFGAMSLGVDREKIQKMLAEGQGEGLADYLQNSIAKRAEAAEKAMNGFNGSLSNLYDLFQQLSGRVSQPVFDQLTLSFQTFMDAMSHQQFEETLRSMATSITAVVSAGTQLTTWAIQNADAIVTITTDVGIAATAFGALKLAMMAFTSASAAISSGSILSLINPWLALAGAITLAVEAERQFVSFLKRDDLQRLSVNTELNDSLTALNKMEDSILSVADKEKLLNEIESRRGQAEAYLGTTKDKEQIEAVTRYIGLLDEMHDRVMALSNTQLEAAEKQRAETARVNDALAQQKVLIEQLKDAYQEQLNNFTGYEAGQKYAFSTMTPDQQLKTLDEQAKSALAQMEIARKIAAQSNIAHGQAPNSGIIPYPDDDQSIKAADSYNKAAVQYYTTLTQIDALKKQIATTDQVAAKKTADQYQKLSELQIQADEAVAQSRGATEYDVRRAEIIANTAKELLSVRDMYGEINAVAAEGLIRQRESAQLAIAQKQEAKARLDLENQLAQTRAQQALSTISAKVSATQNNPFLTTDQRNEALADLYRRQEQAIRASMQVNTAQMATTNDETARLQLQGQNQELEKQLELLQNQKRVITEIGQFQSSMVSWYNGLGTTATQAAGVITGTLDTAISSATNNLQKAVSGTESWGEAFQQIGDDILVTLEQLIIKMMLIQALQAAMGPGTFVGASLLGTVAHSGGVIGRDTLPAAPMSLPRYHGGGIVGDEVPAILRKGEGVFTEEQMAALGGARETKVTILNTQEPDDIASYLAANPDVVINALSRRKSVVQRMLNS